MRNNQNKREADSIKIIGVIGISMLAMLAAIGIFEVIDFTIGLFA